MEIYSTGATTQLLDILPPVIQYKSDGTPNVDVSATGLGVHGDDGPMHLEKSGKDMGIPMNNLATHMSIYLTTVLNKASIVNCVRCLFFLFGMGTSFRADGLFDRCLPE